MVAEVHAELTTDGSTIVLHGEKAAGRVALIDASDYALVSRFRWHVLEVVRPGRRSTGPYAVANAKVDGRWTKIRMHCLIMGQPGIDHRDGNGLNNQRYNLRVATDSQNHANERPGTYGTSQFKGVYWDESRQKFQAYITVNRKRTVLGRFSVEEDAARAYDTAALKAWGEYARLNFPADDAL